MPRKEISNHDLFRAVNAGFTGVEERMATKEQLQSVEERMTTKDQLQLVADNLDLARADIHDIKITLGPLVRHMAASERRMNEFDKRLERVERKVGFTK